MSLILRDYQETLVQQARARRAHGVRRLCLQSATGSGKTVLIAHLLAIAAAKGRRAFFCVHRRELVDQSVRTFVEAADIHTGIIAAGYPTNPLAPVQVCSVPTLAKRLTQLQTPDLLVWDECHHVPSASWTRIAQTYPEATQIGLTATPQRLDSRGLRPFFDELICGPTVADLIAQGWLSPYRFFAPGRSVDLAGVKTIGGDYNKYQLTAAMDTSTVVGDALAHYRQHCPTARALIFLWSIESSERLAAQFVAAGIPAAHLDGETLHGERTRTLQAFRDGDIRVLCNVDLFGEGLDVPAVDAIFLLRPTRSLGVYLQQIGRGLRPSPGKTSVSIFDHASNWQRHGLPDDPRRWTLDGRETKAKTVAPALKRCPQCLAVNRAGRSTCSECGAVLMKQPRQVEQMAGALAETNVDDLRALRKQWTTFGRECHSLADWQALATRLHYKAGWAWHQWQFRKRRFSGG